MAEANLNETLLMYTLRMNQLNLDITSYQSQKSLALYSQGDARSLKNAQEHEVRDFFKKEWLTLELDDNGRTRGGYLDYTKMPDFEDEINKITAELNDKIEELTAWETQLDAQITTASAEYNECKGYKDSFKAMLTSNIQEDYNFGLK